VVFKSLNSGKKHFQAGEISIAAAFFAHFLAYKVDELVKSQTLDGTVKSSSCKTRKSYYPLTVIRCPSTNNALTVNGELFP